MEIRLPQRLIMNFHLRGLDLKTGDNQSVPEPFAFCEVCATPL